MKLRLIIVSFSLIVGPWCCALALCADTPSTSPATQPATLPARGPQEVLKGYNAAMRAGDSESIEKIFLTRNDAERRVVRAMGRAEAHVGRMLAASEAKFGADGVAKVQRAFRDNSDSDIDAAEVRITGERAVVSFGGTNNTVFVLVDGSWKVPAASLLADGDADPDLVIDEISRRGNFAKVLAQEITAGQLKSLEDVINRVEKRQRNAPDGSEN